MILDVNDIATMHDAIQTFCRYLEANGATGDCVFDSKLVASELLGNVLRHTNAGAKVAGEIKDGFFELRIYSEVLFVPPSVSRKADVYAEHGRGLFLVDSVCAERSTGDEGSIVVRMKIN